MSDSPAIVFAFLEQISRDRSEGRTRSLAEYQALFPGHDDVIEREHSRIISGGTIEESSTGGARGSAAARVGGRIGHYVIERELGRGGQATVYLAQDTRLARQVALKVLAGGAADFLHSQSERERFRREAVVAARLDHPGISTVFEAGEADGVAFVAMRFVPGETLAAKIARLRENPAPIDRAELFARLEIIERAARALHAAHEAGVVHRDVKPSNLMLAPDGQVVVLDFGLARDLDQAGVQLTQSGDVFGTPAYMSPEHLATDKIRFDARTDIFSLGVTLFELVTLKRPFDAPTRQGMFHALLTQDPPRVRDLVPAAPRDLDVIVATALAKERVRRYTSAAALADDLRALIESRPIAARRPSLGERFLLWMHREPRLAALILALVVALIGAAGALGYLAASSRELTAGRVEVRRQEIEQAQLDAYAGYNMPAAMSRLEKLLGDDPTFGSARVSLCTGLLEAKNKKDAERVLHLTDIRTDDPDLAAALARLRLAALKILGRDADAAAIEAKLTPEPNGPIESNAAGLILLADRSNDLSTEKTAARYLTRAVLLSSRPEQPILYKRTLALVYAQEFDDARVAADALERLFPDAGQTWFAIGTLRGTVGDHAGAITAFERAVKLEPRLSQAWLMLALARLGTGALPEAQQAYEHVLAEAELSEKLGMKPVQVASWWGNALFSQGHFAESIVPLKKALAEKPDLESESRTLENALLRIGDKDGAIAELERRLKVAPDDAAAREELERLRGGE